MPTKVKPHSLRANEATKAKIFFDVCRFSFDFFWLSFDRFRTRSHFCLAWMQHNSLPLEAIKLNICRCIALFQGFMLTLPLAFGVNRPLLALYPSYSTTCQESKLGISLLVKWADTSWWPALVSLKIPYRDDWYQFYTLVRWANPAFTGSYPEIGYGNFKGALWTL